jgi:hypothetical protein
MVTRVPGSSGLDDDETNLKAEKDQKVPEKRNQDTRQTLYDYVVEDFSAR